MCEGSSIVRRVPYQDYDTTRAVVVEPALLVLEREVRERLLLGRTGGESTSGLVSRPQPERCRKGKHQEKEESDESFCSFGLPSKVDVDT